MASPPKVLVVALEACDPAVMRRLAAEGKAPTIASLLHRAAQARTAPPVGVYESGVWPTLFTACSPARHGYTCFEELDVGTYDHRETSPREIRVPSFWETLSGAGRRVAVIDVPHSAVSGPVNGIQIVEWGPHDRHLGFHTSPPSLATEVERQFGLHPIGGVDAYDARQFAPCDLAHRAGGARRTPREAQALLTDLLAGIDRKVELSLHCIDKEEWDLSLTVFGEAHCVGHQFWFLHDPADPAHDPDLAADIGDPVARVYTRLDQAIGAHLERAGPDTAVFVILSHGMGPMNSGVFLIDAVLRRLAKTESSDPRGRRLVRALKGTWRGLPMAVRRRLAPTVAHLVRRRLRNAPDGLAPYQELFDRCPGCSAARAPLDGQPWFVVPNNTACGGIRINLVGREPHGVVERVSEFDRVCKQLAADLLDVVKVETGEPLVREVIRASDHFDRREPDSFPDVFLDWDRRSRTKTVYSPKIGIVHEPYDHWRTGEHFPDGLLLATGPGIRHGAVLPSIPVEDIAPTICARLGVELPDVDGCPIPELSETPSIDAVSSST
jgi:predicted AlkP superfamily phosphohydrolase/phosphomutase